MHHASKKRTLSLLISPSVEELVWLVACSQVWSHSIPGPRDCSRSHKTCRVSGHTAPWHSVPPCQTPSVPHSVQTSDWKEHKQWVLYKIDSRIFLIIMRCPSVISWEFIFYCMCATLQLPSLGSCSYIDTCISNYYCAMLGITLPICILWWKGLGIFLENCEELAATREWTGGLWLKCSYHLSYCHQNSQPTQFSMPLCICCQNLV